MAPIMRAAIDFGSGAIKMQMAVVDSQEHRIIGEPLFTKYFSLGLIEDVALHGGHISEEKAQIALNILAEFKTEAQEIAATSGSTSMEFAGAATAVFRKAQNGYDLLKRFEQQLGIPFYILTQDEEGKLGFLTAKALYPDVPEGLLLAWDSGSGSFQMTVREGENYQGPLGQGTVRVLLCEEIRNEPISQAHESLNPVLQREAVELTQKIKSLLPPLPDWLRRMLHSDNLVIATFGYTESIFSLTVQALANLNGIKEPVKRAIISISDVQRVIAAYLEQDDNVFNSAGLHHKTLTSALHLSAVMQHTGIQQVHYQRSLGITSGMLITAKLWISTVPNSGSG